MMEITVWFYLLLFVVAFLYASVGHGGASGYLALMALFSMPVAEMRPSALVLNLFVSLTAFIHFYGKDFRWKLFWMVAAASIPMAFVGGMISLPDHVYYKVLGVLLLFVILRFIGLPAREMEDTRPPSTPLALLLGGIIGLLSGMIGIGGGIILSPVIILLRWAGQREAAAISALFIFVNSVSGLLGDLSTGLVFPPHLYQYILPALAGGFAGSFFGAKKFSGVILKRLLAGVVLIAIIKMFSY